MKVSYEKFEEMAKDAFYRIPSEFRDRLDNIDIVVAERPEAEFFKERRFSLRNLLGLYCGVPLRRRGIFYSNVLSDRIILYKDNIESRCKNEEELKRKIEDVLLHEIGHYFGLSEKELRSLEKGTK